MLRKTLVTLSLHHGSLGRRLLVVSRIQAAGVCTGCGRVGPRVAQFALITTAPPQHTHERKSWEGSHWGISEAGAHADVSV